MPNSVFDCNKIQNIYFTMEVGSILNATFQACIKEWEIRSSYKVNILDSSQYQSIWTKTKYAPILDYLIAKLRLCIGLLGMFKVD